MSTRIPFIGCLEFSLNYLLKIMRPEGKNIVVTGGGNGMGRELVLQLLTKGARVAAVDMNENSLEETKKLAGSHAKHLSLHKLDITDREMVMKFPGQLQSLYPHMDGIINNAGIIQPFVRVNDLKFSDIDHVMNVNFYGSLNMIKAFLPDLLTRPEAHIVNISSMGGFLPVPGQSVYGASKAAIKLLSEALYAELRSTGVRVSVVFPGAVATNIAANSGIVIDRNSPNAEKTASIKMMPATMAAKMILEGMEKNKTRIYVGKDSSMLNLLYRLSPGMATDLIGKKMGSLLP